MIKSFIKRIIKKSAASFTGKQRDSRYIIWALAALIVFCLSTLQAMDAGLFDSVERPVFEFFNTLPMWLQDAMYAVTQLGGLGGLLLWIPVAWYFVNRRAAAIVFVSSIWAWFAAKLIKAIVQRERPSELLSDVVTLGSERLGGFGFPSGHATVAAACATVLYYQVPPKYRKYLIITALLVGISRMYLGAHFPLDIVGGLALGVIIGASSVFLIGATNNGIGAAKLKRVLTKRGYEIASLQFAPVDARGSRPVFITDMSGKMYFAKIFGKQEHAADWLFKVYRFFRYKNLQAEEPFMNSRRNIEMEACATLWAKQAGVRTATVVDIVQIGSLWMLIQERLDAKILSDSTRIRTKSLEDAWRQVARMHAAHMAHRDLRAANLMLDKQGQAWIIDFGFAELAARPQRQYMDIAELLMSMSLVAGVKRTVDAAASVYDHDRLQKALPYLQKSVFSGATSKGIKDNKEILQELKDALRTKFAIKDDIDDADILRVNRKKIINVVLLAAFIYVIIPQLREFSGVLDSLLSIQPVWLVPLVVASALTYYLTGIIYVALAQTPLKNIRTALVQLAASFVSKIVPGGVGTASVNARYLIKSGLSGSDASAIIAAQGIIGFATFIIPLALFMLINGSDVSRLVSFDVDPRMLLAVVVALIVIAAVTVLVSAVRMKATELLTKFVASVREISSSPREFVYAAAASFGVTLLYIACLYASVQAFGIELGIAAIVLIYATAVIAKSAIPTPGGLGPLEIAMVSSMIGLGVDRPEAVSVVILYRLATFWLPVPFSVLAYKYLSKRKYI